MPADVPLASVANRSSWRLDGAFPGVAPHPGGHHQPEPAANPADRPGQRAAPGFRRFSYGHTGFPNSPPFVPGESK